MTDYDHRLMKGVHFLRNTVLLLLLCTSLHAQEQAATPSGFSTYFDQRVSHFKTLPQSTGSIVFLGNSITDGAEWSELFSDLNIKNRGISGDITAGILYRLNELTAIQPAKIFLMIGVNDLAQNATPDAVISGITKIITTLQQNVPAAKLFIQSILPVNKSFGKFAGHVDKSAQILKVNTELNKLAKLHNVSYINLYDDFSDASGSLDARYTNDGLHLSGEGYLLWKHLLYPYVYGREQRASLIPYPQVVNYTREHFFLHRSAGIYSPDSALAREMRWLQQSLSDAGIRQPLLTAPEKEQPYIHIALGNVEAPMNGQEAYAIDIDADRIIVIANTAAGIHHGLQTLIQLLRDGVAAEGCSITDWPAFSWRGYMIDVGRNYMSMELLKQKIDYLSRYKYNIFHFHVTEDIAWRIAIDRYPQLTAPEHMLRDKGMYYTEAEIRELIRYCHDRHITFVPEIDMPGHSAAFSRALGFDMQSDSGLIAVKHILRELVGKYDLPYWHIGADEVKITNQQFLPEVSRLMDSLQRRIIGWEPGGNFSDNTIRQLWMEDVDKIARQQSVQYIDSRHLYLNHMDPLEAVTTIFFRKLSDRDVGNAQALGATLCTWNDRAAASEHDIMRMNPVYPGILTFAERAWRGGGKKGWTAFMDASADSLYAAFKKYEYRLMDHKEQFFRDKPFPYAIQQHLQWKLYGPYPNKGMLNTAFAPEQAGSKWDSSAYQLQVSGGTIVLRHWWHPLVQGVLKNAADSSTWYATTRFWSDADGLMPCWIGFNNLSRSPSTDSPPRNAWDEKGSALWVNQQLVAPPNWLRAGQQGHSEIPLTDEGYEYRKPAFIPVRKGWNEVLVKVPVGSFRGRNWHNPVKWMFTFMPLSR